MPDALWNLVVLEGSSRATCASAVSRCESQISERPDSGLICREGPRRHESSPFMFEVPGSDTGSSRNDMARNVAALRAFAALRATCGSTTWKVRGHRQRSTPCTHDPATDGSCSTVSTMVLSMTSDRTETAGRRISKGICCALASNNLKRRLNRRQRAHGPPARTD